MAGPMMLAGPIGGAAHVLWILHFCFFFLTRSQYQFGLNGRLCLGKHMGINTSSGNWGKWVLCLMSFPLCQRLPRACSKMPSAVQKASVPEWGGGAGSVFFGAVYSKGTPLLPANQYFSCTLAARSPEPGQAPVVPPPQERGSDQAREFRGVEFRGLSPLEVWAVISSSQSLLVLVPHKRN